MSLCRWSSDYWRSDVYAYESCHGGVEVHVASTHLVVPDEAIAALPPFPDPGSPGWVEEFMAWKQAENEARDAASSVPVPPAWAGRSFTVHDVDELVSLLERMKTDGVWVPDFLMEAVKDPDHEIDFGDED